MKIQAFNNPYNILQSDRKNRVCFRGIANIQAANSPDVFEKRKHGVSVAKQSILSRIFSGKTQKQHPAYAKFLERNSKFSVDDFLSLSEEDRFVIKQEIGLECLLPVCTNVNFARGIKQFLDEKYGNNEYVFVSIGKSPSLIAKVLEYMGVETKYLPMSKLGRKDNQFSDIDSMFLEYKFDKYGDFMRRQGITAEKLGSESKKYIFYDYTFSGDTLKRFERIMKEKFALPDDKIEFRSLDEDILRLFEGKIIIDDIDAAQEYVETYFNHGVAEKYSIIRGLPYTRVDIANYEPDALAKYDEWEPKIFNFLVMDNLNSLGMLQNNPLNSSSL